MGGGKKNNIFTNDNVVNAVNVASDQKPTVKIEGNTFTVSYEDCREYKGDINNFTLDCCNLDAAYTHEIVTNALNASDFDTTVRTRWFLYDTGAQLVLAQGVSADAIDNGNVTLTEFATFSDITDITSTTLTTASTIDFV